MPELPEVETVRTVLNNNITNVKIVDIQVYYDKIIKNAKKEDFIKELVGQKITNIGRKGKFLIFLLEKSSLLVHLRMEGKFYIKSKDEPLEKHEHLEFILADGRTVRYHDTRKFGRFTLLKTTDMTEIMKSEELKALGPDANLVIDPLYVYNKFLTSRLPIKQVLLDQSIIAGIGNIYANEICFRARVHPLTIASNLTLNQVRTILAEAKDVLTEAIIQGGTTIRSYTSSLGVTGRFQNNLYVHGRDKEPCLVCQTPIKKIRVGGRGTYYCPNCQKMEYDFTIVGITGPIASGKTMVTAILEDMAFDIIDADKINRYLLSPEYPMYHELLVKISHIIPTAVDLDNDEIDKRLIRDKIFEDSLIKREMEQLIHPLVEEEVLKELKAMRFLQDHNKVVFLSAPLLIQSGLDLYCDQVWIMKIADRKSHAKRLAQRDNISIDEAYELINNDMNKFFEHINMHKTKYYFIDNSKSINELIEQIKERMEHLS